MLISKSVLLFLIFTFFALPACEKSKSQKDLDRLRNIAIECAEKKFIYAEAMQKADYALTKAEAIGAELDSTPDSKKDEIRNLAQKEIDKAKVFKKEALKIDKEMQECLEILSK